MTTISDLAQLMRTKPEQANFDNGCSLYFDAFDNEYFVVVTPDRQRQIKSYRDTSPEELLKTLTQW
jgi:hypothetical protein